MLESLADHDDELMEQLLEDIPPPRDKVFDDLAKELRDGLICPVLIGSATRTNGVLRLMKALRHEAPGVADTVKRLGVKPTAMRSPRAQDAAHRAWRQDVGRARARTDRSATAPPSSRRTARRAASPACSSCSATTTRSAAPRRPAKRSRSASSNTPRPATRSPPASRRISPSAQVTPYPPVLAIAISAKERKDDVKLGQALNKLIDEDPSLTVVHNPETHEIVVWGQGEMHLRVATERLADRFSVPIERRKPSVGYRETIKKPVLNVRGRHKKQSGGHGQFGDVVIDVKPLPRGAASSSRR